MPLAGQTLAMRWYASDKARLVGEVWDNPRHRSEILARHDVSEEEFTQWERLFEQGGRRALQAGVLQRYRYHWRSRPPRKPHVDTTKADPPKPSGEC
jgi:transposase-like protein